MKTFLCEHAHTDHISNNENDPAQKSQKHCQRDLQSGITVHVNLMDTDHLTDVPICGSITLKWTYLRQISHGSSQWTDMAQNKVP
jgi:hypothetical protein